MIKHFKKDFVSNVLVYILATIFILSLSSLSNNFQNEKDWLKKNKQKLNQDTLNYNTTPFQNLEIKAKAFVVYDLVENKVIFGKNEKRTLPLASITKIMTALTALANEDKEKLITIGKINPDGSYDLGLKKNQIWKLDELIKYTLLFSSNDGAQVIANNDIGGSDEFIKKMNTKAKALDLNMYFTHPAGLDLNNQIGGLGNAVDVAKLMGYAVNDFPDILETTTKARNSVIANKEIIRGIPNTNQSVDQFAGIEASKTGYTDSAGGNLALVVDVSLGRPVAIVVLGSTKNERFTDAVKLYNALKESLIGSVK